MADATPKPPVQTFSPWVFVNEGLRESLARALADYKPENADPVQLASATADAIALLNSLAPEFNGARVQIEATGNSSHKQNMIIVQGRKFLS